MRLIHIFLASTVLLLSSCNKPMPGADRDSNGCLGSAGYLWCMRTNQCERPWELEQRIGIEIKDNDGFVEYCMGSDDSAPR